MPHHFRCLGMRGVAASGFIAARRDEVGPVQTDDGQKDGEMQANKPNHYSGSVGW